MSDITFEENEAIMKDARSKFDVAPLQAPPSEKVLELKTVEAFVNGKYSPQCTISTNAETEYVTITFQDFRSTTQLMLTKKSFEEFLSKLELFRDMASSRKTNKRQLLVEQSNSEVI